MMWPHTIAPAVVYATCLSFRAPTVRAAYLEAIRLRRIRVEGPVPDAPPELLNDPRVEEEVARLREQWYEMAN
jgi:hypothetical protein